LVKHISWIIIYPIFHILYELEALHILRREY